MMAHAIDTPAPTTIFLISGDRDFVYAVSILALRQYRIVLLAPKVAHSSLKAQADVVYHWPDDFLPESETDGADVLSQQPGKNDTLHNSWKPPQTTFFSTPTPWTPPTNDGGDSSSTPDHGRNQILNPLAVTVRSISPEFSSTAGHSWTSYTSTSVNVL